MAVGDLLRGAVKRLDDWYSTAIGLGGTSDKVASVAFRYGAVRDWNELDALYHQDGYAARIVDLIPSECMREGFRVVVSADLDDLEGEADKTDKAKGDALEQPAAPNPPPPGSPQPGQQPPAMRPPPQDAGAMRAQAAKKREKMARLLAEREANKEAAEVSAKVTARLRELGAQERLQEAWCWGRLFGGGIVVMGIDDGRSMDQPVNEAAIRTVRYLQVLDRRYVSIRHWVTDPEDPCFGEPDLYGITSSQPGATVPLREIHASRVIVFGGARTSAWMKLANNGWDLSVLDRCYEQLRRYNASVAAASQLVQDASQAVYRIKGLWSIIAADGGKGDVQARIEILEKTRSVLRAILLDTDEEFRREPTTFTGLTDVLSVLQGDLTGVLGWSVTLLFGRSPAGLNATGESDYRTILDLLRGEQMGTLKPRAERLVRMILLEQDGPTKGEEPEKWEILFNPMRQPTPEESAAIQKSVAEGDKLWTDLGIPKPAIIRSHFRSDGFSASLDLDAEAIVAEMEADEADRLEQGADVAEGESAAKDAAAQAETEAAAKKAEADDAADKALEARLQQRRAAKGTP